MAELTEILSGQAETLVVHNHLQQMLTFIRGGGVEFLPQVDSNNIRKSFIDGIVKTNRLKTRIKGMAVKMMKYGKLLLYLRPVGNGYRIQDYKPEQYRAYYDAAGNLDSVVIIYGYKKRIENQNRDAWIKLRITSTTIEKWDLEAKPEFDGQSGMVPQVVDRNRLGFIPCKEVLNPAPATEEEGLSDFAPLASQIQAHDDITTAILDNLYFFVNSPLLTTRQANEITEAVAAEPNRQSVSFASDFREGWQQIPFSKAKTRRERRLKRVIGGIETDELFQQLQINAVPGDLTVYADQYERQLRESLGGILERGIETATESRVVYGKVLATAKDKQEALFTYGLCEILEMAIKAEEMLFAASQMVQLPNGQTLGLPALGDRTVNWRVGEVFAQTPESLNYRSITARNLAKFFGVSPKACIQYVFPEKSETEIDGMVGEGGFPSDYLQTTIGIYQQLAQTLDPMTGLPLADPMTGLPMAEKLIPFILTGLQYGDEFNPIIPDTREPDTSLDRLNAAVSWLIGRQQQQQQSGGGGLVPGTVGQPDQPPSTEQLPAPDSTVAASPGLGGFLDFSRSPILNAARQFFSP